MPVAGLSSNATAAHYETASAKATCLAVNSIIAVCRKFWVKYTVDKE
jgi:hypothetical protein